MYRAITNLILSPIFLIMFFNDKEWTRKLYFFTYSLYIALNMVYDFIIASEKIGNDKDGALKEACTDMKNDGHSWDALGIKTMDECIAHIEGYVWGGFYTFFVLYTLINLHFIWVVFSHW